MWRTSSLCRNWYFQQTITIISVDNLGIGWSPANCIDFLFQIRHKKEFVIVIDFKSVLQAFEIMILEISLVMLHHDLTTNSVVICWILSHIGIVENEKTDMAIWETLILELSEVFIPYTYFRPNMIEYANKLWKLLWMKRSKINYQNAIYDLSTDYISYVVTYPTQFFSLYCMFNVKKTFTLTSGNNRVMLDDNSSNTSLF